MGGRQWVWLQAIDTIDQALQALQWSSKDYKHVEDEVAGTLNMHQPITLKKGLTVEFPHAENDRMK